MDCYHLCLINYHLPESFWFSAASCNLKGNKQIYTPDVIWHRCYAFYMGFSLFL